jgi:hypothetical protein
MGYHRDAKTTAAGPIAMDRTGRLHPDGPWHCREEAMSEKRIRVWVQHFADRPHLMLQWYDEKGKRKSKSAETCNPLEAERLLRVADGDDSALPAVHDRLNVLSNFDGADRIRRLVGKLTGGFEHGRQV